MVKFLSQFLPFSCLQKMSECEGIEACHAFMTELVPYILPFRQRMFVLIDYSVSSDDFVIKINYDKYRFEHLITEFVRNIIKKAQNSKLHRCGWAVDRPLCEDIVDSKNYFLHAVVITITTIWRKQIRKKWLSLRFFVSSKKIIT